MTRPLGMRVTRRQQYGGWFAVESRLVELPQQLSIDVHVVDFPDIAVVVPIAGDEVILVRQFRYPLWDWLVEAPAGRVEPFESPADAAVRELVEETGLTAGHLTLIGTVRLSAHLSNEVTHLFLATDLVPGEPSPESGEIVERHPVKRSDLRKHIKEGRIVDAKTIVALLACDII